MASVMDAGEELSIAIGHFDGVHKGHQNVIRRAIEAARSQQRKSAVLTFHPHPKDVLSQGEQYGNCLTPLDVKLERFAELGVDYTFVMKFDQDFANVSPERFVSDVLGPLGVRHALIGFDFRFGHRGAGDADKLASLGSELGITTEVVEPLLLNGKKVSSTYVREALSDGDPELAQHLLGRAYEVQGTVVHGHARGRTIGFPTANLGLIAPYVTPRLGVYAVFAEVGGVTYSAVMNHGMKPTFKDGETAPVMEVHLLDYAGDLYGQKMAVRFHAFLRAERKFESIDELIAQISRDRDEAQNRLAQAAEAIVSPTKRPV
ncbi:bifunctional riboflavin kinase/FAD synthetase [Paenibacillus sp. MMS18-CY102]|nr:bifunctional riboflavin kinase/FAD synthetase [Paenibacillus sp. MMS18-CY102]